MMEPNAHSANAGSLCSPFLRKQESSSFFGFSCSEQSFHSAYGRADNFSLLRAKKSHQKKARGSAPQVLRREDMRTRAPSQSTRPRHRTRVSASDPAYKQYDCDNLGQAALRPLRFLDEYAIGIYAVFPHTVRKTWGATLRAFFLGDFLSLHE